MEGFNAVPEPVVPDESQRIEDIEKAQEMAEAGDRLRTQISGSPKYREEYPGQSSGLRDDLKVATESADELRDDAEKADAKRGHLDNIHVREYVEDNLKKRIEGTEDAAEKSEGIAGIIYELQNQDTLYNLSLEDVKQITEIIDNIKKRPKYKE